MNPNQGELFRAVAENRIPSLREEFLRRELLSSTLAELSELFEERITTEHPVTEPTLFARLYALSQIKHTPLGINGFNPMQIVNFASKSFDIKAKAAPYHDEYEQSETNFRTRIIRFGIADDEEERKSEIDIFGINIYIPEINVEDLFESDPEPKPSLIIVGGQGETLERRTPITGETVVFAVRNNRTNDAKLYRITILDPNSPERHNVQSQITHLGDGRSLVALQDGLIVEIEQMKNQLQEEILQELQICSEKLKRGGPSKSDLSDEERHAAISSVRIATTEHLDP